MGWGGKKKAQKNSVKESKWWKRQVVKTQRARKHRHHSGALALLCACCVPDAHLHSSLRLFLSSISKSGWVGRGQCCRCSPLGPGERSAPTTGEQSMATQPASTWASQGMDTKARNFVWHFEQTLTFSMEPCVSLCFKNGLTIHLCERYDWGDLRWCGK